MQSPVLVDVPTVIERLGLGSDAKLLGQVESALCDVSALIRDVAGREWSEAPHGVPASVVTVVTRVVDRVIRNPRQLESESTQGYTYRLDARSSTGVYLTERECRIIRRAVRRTGIYTIPVSRAATDPALAGCSPCP